MILSLLRVLQGGQGGGPQQLGGPGAGMADAPGGGFQPASGGGGKQDILSSFMQGRYGGSGGMTPFQQGQMAGGDGKGQTNILPMLMQLLSFGGGS